MAEVWATMQTMRGRGQGVMLAMHVQTNLHYVGFEVLTAVVIKSTILWDITPCSPLSVNRRFGETYRLNLKCEKISRARNQRKSRWQVEPAFTRFLARFIK
jgi:hypothetical protein